MTSPHTTADPFADTAVIQPTAEPTGLPPACRWNKTDDGWAVRGPARVVQAGATVTVSKRDGDTQTVTLGQAIEPSPRRSYDTEDMAVGWPAVDKVTADPPEGFHILPGDGRVSVYKVQRAVHGSGKLYAKVLVPGTGDALGTGTWAYAGRAPFSQLSEDTILTLEKAQQFGRLYGICCRCGATLTDENSIKRGIGPVCASRF